MAIKIMLTILILFGFTVLVTKKDQALATKGFLLTSFFIAVIAVVWTA